MGVLLDRETSHKDRLSVSFAKESTQKIIPYQKKGAA